MSDPYRVLSARAGKLRAHRGDHDPEVVSAARELATETITRFITERLANVPGPLTREQQARIRNAYAPGRSAVANSVASRRAAGGGAA